MRRPALLRLVPARREVETLTKLGLHRRKARPKKRSRAGRSLSVEPLEPRVLLAADLAVTSFSSDGTDWTLQYDVTGEAATPFDLDVMRSADGVSADAVLETVRISDAADLTVGSHTRIIAPDFIDTQEDYHLRARIDAGSEVAETDETNNTTNYAGGVFLADDGTLYVHGTAADDDITIKQPGLLKAIVNGTTYQYTASDITEVHVRTHDGDDDVTGTSGLTKPMWIFGGAGADALTGGTSDDYLSGGTGDDWLKGRSGNDLFYAGTGDDTVLGDAGNDTIYGGDGDDVLTGDGGSNTLDGGRGIDTLDGTQETNTAPTSSGLAAVTVDEDAAATVLDLFAAFEDVEHYDSELTFSITANTNPSLFSATPIDATAGNLTLSYAPNANGAAILTVRATDPLGLLVETDLSVNVTPINDVPTSPGLLIIDSNEDADPLNFNLGDVFDDVEDLDADLTYELVDNDNPGLFVSAAVIGSQLALVYASNKTGFAFLTVRATDTGGATEDLSVRIQLIPVNDVPTTSGIADVTALDTDLPTVIDLAAAFDDVDIANDGDDLTYTIESNTNPSLFASTTIDNTADTLTLTYTPLLTLDPQLSTLTIRATDTSGATVETTFQVDVVATNTPPLGLGIPNIYVQEDADPIVADLISHFVDAEDDYVGDPDSVGENLTIEVASNSNPDLVTATVDMPGGIVTFQFAPNASGVGSVVLRATDSGGLWVENQVIVTVDPVNDAPQIGELMDAPDPAIEGAILNLEADNVTDDGAVAQVDFYHDTNRNDVLDVGTDQLLGTDTDGTDGWKISTSTAGFGPGSQRYFAVATDDAGLTSNTATSVGEVGIVAILDDSAPGYSETGTGWTLSSGPSSLSSFNGSHREHAPGTGGNTATWTFDGLIPGPYKIHATWTADAANATNASYTIYDGTTIVATVTADQTAVPEDIFDANTGWAKLGTFTIASGSISIVLSDAANGTVIADAIRLLDPPPTIGSLSDTPDPIAQGDDFTLTAQNVQDVDGTVTGVAFYQDANANGQFDDGVDTLLGAGTDNGDGTWSRTVDSNSLSLGAQTFFAVATDDDSLTSEPASTETLVVGPAVIVDNGDANFTETGTGWTDKNVIAAYSGHQRQHVSGTGANGATWTFENLEPGKRYQVLATWWGPGGSTATNAPFEVWDNATLVSTTLANQKNSPNDVTISGKKWESLGLVTLASDRIVVTLSDNANGTVVADAVRVVEFPVGAESPPLVDDGDAFYAETGGNWQTLNLIAGYGGDLRYHDGNGTGDNYASWRFENLDPAKSYQIYTRWFGSYAAASNAPFRVYVVDPDSVGNATPLTTVRLNQRATPQGNVFDGKAWESLGAFTPTSGILEIRLADDANGQIRADAVRLAEVVPVTVAPEVIDDGDVGYSQSGEDWLGGSVLAAYLNDYRYAPSGTGDHTATWTFDAMQPGTKVHVYASWWGTGANASDAPFSIYDGATLERTVRVSQKIKPNEITLDGKPWESLGVYTIDSDQLVVQLSNAADGRVMADAVRWVEVVDPATPPEIIDDGDDTYAETGESWRTKHVLASNQTDQRQADAGSVNDTAIWTFENLDIGEQYEVYATWFGFPHLATDAQYTIDDVADPDLVGGTTEEAIRSVNQALGPNDQTFDGRSWEGLGIYTVDSGTLSVTLAGNATAAVSADAIRVVQIPSGQESPSLIDDGDSGYSDTNTGWTNAVHNGALGRDARVHAAGTGDGKAFWTFSNLDAGGFEVMATWNVLGSQASNAPFTLYDGSVDPANILTTTRVNQRRDPFGYRDSDRRDWTTIGEIDITSDTLIVELSDDADHSVVADAVMLLKEGTVRSLVAPHTIMSSQATLLEADIVDPRGLADSVSFYRDVNGDNVIDAGDELLGIDNDGSDGWQAQIAANVLVIGNAAMMVQAAAQGNPGFGTLGNVTNAPGLNINVTDNVAIVDNLATTSGNDADDPNVNLSGGGYSETSNGQTAHGFAAGWKNGSDKGFGGDSRKSYLPTGTDTATWTFGTLEAGTYEVYATYVTAANHSDHVPYKITSTGGSADEDVIRSQRPGEEPTVTKYDTEWVQLAVVTVGANGQITVTATSTGTADCWVIADAVMIERQLIDLDIDSDNNNGFAAPDESNDEDTIEDTVSEPGKYVLPNTGDIDNDNIPDYLDGYDLNGVADDADDTISNAGDAKFTPLILKLDAIGKNPDYSEGDDSKDYFDAAELAKSYVRFTYSANEPDPNVGSANGKLRLWTADLANGLGIPRNKASVTIDADQDGNADGDYITPDVWFPVSTIASLATEGKFTFYIEGIEPTLDESDRRIKVEFAKTEASGGAGITESEIIASDAVLVGYSSLTAVGANDDAFVTKPGAAFDIAVAELLDNDAPFGNSSLTVDSIYAPNIVGDLVDNLVNDGLVSYTAPERTEDGPAFEGSELFEYTVSDSDGNEDKAIVEIYVHNDELPFAENLAVGEEVFGKIGDGIFGIADVDLYQVQLNFGEDYQIELTTPDGLEGAGIVRLFDEFGSEVGYYAAGEDHEPTPSIQFRAGIGGVHYLGISGTGNDLYAPQDAASGLTGQQETQYRLLLSTPGPQDPVTIPLLTTDSVEEDTPVEPPRFAVFSAPYQPTFKFTSIIVASSPDTTIPEDDGAARIARLTELLTALEVTGVIQANTIQAFSSSTVEEQRLTLDAWEQLQRKRERGQRYLELLGVQSVQGAAQAPNVISQIFLDTNRERFDGQLFNFVNLSEDQQEKILDELTRIEYYTGLLKQLNISNTQIRVTLHDFKSAPIEEQIDAVLAAELEIEFRQTPEGILVQQQQDLANQLGEELVERLQEGGLANIPVDVVHDLVGEGHARLYLNVNGHNALPVLQSGVPASISSGNSEIEHAVVVSLPNGDNTHTDIILEPVYVNDAVTTGFEMVELVTRLDHYEMFSKHGPHNIPEGPQDDF